MRVLSVFVVVLMTLSGLHASAVQQVSSNEQYHPQLAAAASHAFRAMAASDGIPGVSAACQASIDSINSSPTVQAAKQSTVRTGCLAVNYNNQTICPMTQSSPTSVSINCNCVETTDVTLVTAAVQALGGKMCPATMLMTMSASMSANGQTATVSMNVKQAGGYQIYGPQCTTQDIQNSLDATAKQGVDAAKGVFAGNSNGIVLNAINLQITACSQSASSSTGAGSMVVVSWLSMLCVMVMSSLMIISL